MKYRDILTLFLGIILILSLGYVLGVDSSFWPIPIVLFGVLVFFYYKLYIEK